MLLRAAAACEQTAAYGRALPLDGETDGRGNLHIGADENIHDGGIIAWAWNIMACAETAIAP